MKKMIALMMVLGCAGALVAAESAAIRVDTRMGLFGGKMATGVEAVGEMDGSLSSSWVTTNMLWDGSQEFPDGWYVRQDDGTGLQDWFALGAEDTPDHDVLLLNRPVVAGGRLTADELWTTDTVHVVRHNVVVPAGVTLTVDPEAIVKFTEEARIVVEEGGRWVAKGAHFAEIADDEWIDGDTNLDGTNSVATGTQDWIAGVNPADYVHVLMLDGAEQVFPTHTYTRGEVYGVLPTVDRYDEGFHFRGWVTNLEDTVGVAADQLAEMDQGALYCNWEAIYLNLSTGAVEFAAYPEGDGATRTVEVSANDKWICTSDADWLTLATAENDGNDAEADIHDGVITIGATPNRSELPRSALVTVSRENGKLVREITVTQLAMEHAAMPEIHTANGNTTFSDYVAQVWITCVTPGVTIYYTTDGSEPSADNGIKLETFDYADGVAGVVNIYNSMTIKAIAVRYNLLDSDVTSVRLVRDATLAEAMDIPELYVTTDGDAQWRVDKDVTFDGISSVKSGKLTTDRNSRRYSRLYTYVEGQGTLTFRWKVSCERDLTGNCDWDYLAFIANGQVIRKIEGNQDWVEVTHKFTGTGAHVIQWVYTKNAGFADINPLEDCGWVDQVTWTPTLFVGEGQDARELYVGQSWLLNVGIVGSSAPDEELVEAAQADDDGDGFTNEAEGILGTDPKDPSSKLEVSISQVDGLMRVDYTPQNTSAEGYDLDYRIMGVTELGGEWKDVTDFTEEERDMHGYRFFKVKVDVKKK
ncbi:MAG: chitobiase/beta-hexosaminidase C-terminal domain-containing protein [Kiritimatiellae bacterium]|nr:chitobiase/beta-hexosaminidase C-terminal domain-containing protein [Kiritimatiellia bacterium]